MRTNKEFAAVIGRNIRLLRMKEDIPQKLLAEALGLSAPALSLVENGHRNLSAYQLYRAAFELGVSVMDILPGD